MFDNAAQPARPSGVDASGGIRARACVRLALGGLRFHAPAGAVEDAILLSAIEDQVASAGRSSDDCVILPAIEVIVADSETEAKEHADYLDSLATAEMGLTILAAIMNRDLSGVPLDTPLDQVDVGPKGPSGIGAYENLVGKFAKSGPMPSLEEAALLGARTWWSPRLVGSAKQVADHLQELFETKCCDGFVITQALSPGGIAKFVDLVVPELQARGIYRKEYTGKTFRENLRSGN